MQEERHDRVVEMRLCFFLGKVGDYKVSLAETRVCRSTAITAAESSAAGQSIYEYDKNGTVAKAYAEFTREVIQCGEKQRNKHESSLSR